MIFPAPPFSNRFLNGDRRVGNVVAEIVTRQNVFRVVQG